MSLRPRGTQTVKHAMGPTSCILRVSKQSTAGSLLPAQEQPIVRDFHLSISKIMDSNADELRFFTPLKRTDSDFAVGAALEVDLWDPRSGGQYITVFNGTITESGNTYRYKTNGFFINAIDKSYNMLSEAVIRQDFNNQFMSSIGQTIWKSAKQFGGVTGTKGTFSGPSGEIKTVTIALKNKTPLFALDLICDRAGYLWFLRDGNLIMASTVNDFNKKFGTYYFEGAIWRQIEVSGAIGFKGMVQIFPGIKIGDLINIGKTGPPMMVIEIIHTVETNTGYTKIRCFNPTIPLFDIISVTNYWQSKSYLRRQETLRDYPKGFPKGHQTGDWRISHPIAPLGPLGGLSSVVNNFLSLFNTFSPKSPAPAVAEIKELQNWEAGSTADVMIDANGNGVIECGTFRIKIGGLIGALTEGLTSKPAICAPLTEFEIIFDDGSVLRKTTLGWEMTSPGLIRLATGGSPLVNALHFHNSTAPGSPTTPAIPTAGYTKIIG